MKAAKRASQIKGFMRFSFFKQALRAARRGRQFGGASVPCRGSPANGLALPLQFAPSRLRTTSRVILSGGGNLTTFSAGERGCSAAVFRRRRRQCAAPFVHRLGG